MLLLLEINFLHLILPVDTSCIAVGWMTPTASQDPPIPQGGGGLMLWPWPWQGGWGGTRNLEHIYISTVWIWQKLQGTQKKLWCWCHLLSSHSSNSFMQLWFVVSVIDFHAKLVKCLQIEPFWGLWSWKFLLWHDFEHKITSTKLLKF